MKVNSSKILLFLLGLIFADYLIGMIMIDLMEVDTMQYGSIAREMLDSGNYLQLHHRHLDYLDKPPLLFWLSSLSFSIFGFSPFSFRIPSMLFIVLGTYSTYGLAKIYYNKETGILAAVILASSQAWFMISHDPRTDAILAGAVIFGVWQLVEYMRRQKPVNFILGFLGIALAMLEKGPIGIMVPVLAIGSEIIYKKDWKNLFRWQWIAGVLFILLLLSPMIWGLYEQYGWDGVKFYFWTQSFGRITGESVWEDSSGYFYFLHTFLWVFLPWMIIAIYGIFMRIKEIIIKGSSKNTEVLSLGGFLLPFIALSFSHFKLPHYIFVGFPFVAIITAVALQKMFSKKESGTAKIFYYVQLSINAILWAAVIFICIWVFPLNNFTIWFFAIILLIATIYFSIKRSGLGYRILIPSALTIIGLNFLLNTHFYPQLLTYQSGTYIAEYVKENNIPFDDVYTYKKSIHSLDFYLKTIVPILENEEDILKKLNNNGNIWFITNPEGKQLIEKLYPNSEVVEEFKDFHITLLNSQFLDPKTRSSVERKRYIIKINP